MAVATRSARKARLLGFGSTLLDIIVDTSDDFLCKYNLPVNGEMRVSESDELFAIFEDVQNTYKDRMHLRPGGATLNTVKVAQWCLKETGSTVFISCVSNDLTGRTLREAISRAGVEGWFQVKTGRPTGSCLVLCTNSNRCLVTYAGASALLSDDSLDSKEAKVAVDTSHFFYCSGYTMISCYSAVHRLAQHVSSHPGKVFTLNMAAVFVCQQYAECFRSILPFVDVLIGNQMEALALAPACGLQATSTEEIAVEFSGWSRQGEERPLRVVVITRGAAPAVLAVGQQVSCHPAPTVPEGEMVDANGAGDAFAGGFLSSLMKQKSSWECEAQPFNYVTAVQCGHEAAAVVLRQRGCQLPHLQS